jgi:hypothetical protein
VSQLGSRHAQPKRTRPSACSATDCTGPSCIQCSSCAANDGDGMWRPPAPLAVALKKRRKKWCAAAAAGEENNAKKQKKKQDESRASERLFVAKLLRRQIESRK